MGSSNVSSATKFFSTANEGFTTTTSGSVSSGGTTVGLTSVTGLTNATVFAGIVEPGTTKEQTFTGTVDTGGSQITGVIWTRGANVDHSAGVTVVDYVTGTDLNLATKGILVEHGQDGKHTAVTATSINNAGILTQTGVATFTAAPVLPDNAITSSKIASIALNNATLSNPYKFSVYRNSAQNSSNGESQVNFDTELFDTNNNFDAVTNHYYTSPVAGFYMFTWSVPANATPTNKWQTYLYDITNSVAISYGSYYATAAGVTSGGSAFVQLSGSQNISLRLSAGGVNAIFVGASGGAQFQGFLISQT